MLKNRPTENKPVDPASVHADSRIQVTTAPKEVFRAFEHAMRDVEDRAQAILAELFDQEHAMFNQPLLHGLSLHRDASGRPRFRPFGNFMETMESLRAGWREPLVTWDLDEEEHQVNVRVEVPGLTRENISIEIENNCIYVEGQSDVSKYRARCDIDVPLTPEGAKATYDAGILEISVPIMTSHATSPVTVDVQ